MIQQDRVIQEFMELVQVNSETKHEQEISKVLKEKFASLGFSVEEDDSAAKTGHGSGNLIFTLPANTGNPQAPRLFFTCHMDTVAPGNNIKPQLHADGYIRSDGTTILGADDKAGISALLEAIRVLKEQKLEHPQLQVVITAGEESGLVGARAMEAKWIQADYGFALDSNGKIGDIAVAAPSMDKIAITFYGKSAHAGVNPEDGVSAIQVASKAVSRMPLGRIDHETTANVGSFAGGGETNVVCDKVVLKTEARSLDTRKLERQVEAMRRASFEAAEEMGARAEFESYLKYPSFRWDETAPVVQLAMKALRRAGAEPRTFHSGGGSDANIFNGMGIPTVNLAVGYENIHTTKEQIKAADLGRVAETVVAIIQEAVGSGQA
ncbi:M20/M25/M40 family metallo-hydrolase [Paenibacillus aurantius]|uniref:M20/M25/M40 family metallo-hydrolase n=1 Tax=Paenibacillus aurantius TaxID=2918900 RepID=A0AA96L935_9BACL|nr:M20/M25/M40 family metallo-hydrolase [Paenibacillus aurantius]WNQ09369.1 M20/M25/M40 family metallo-hydrolase [Paenibacillus aurantius]